MDLYPWGQLTKQEPFKNEYGIWQLLQELIPYEQFLHPKTEQN